MALLPALPLQGKVYTLPTANQGAWRPGIDVGVVGGIDQYRDGGADARGNNAGSPIGGRVTINVTSAPYNADPTGVADCTAGVQAAVNAASAGDVVYFPAGTFRFKSQVLLGGDANGITIRGAGPALTTIYGSWAGGVVFNVGWGGASGSYSQTLAGTKIKGTRTLSVVSSADYSVGLLATVIVQNEEDNARITAGSAPTWSQSGFPNLRQMVCKVTAVPDSTHITIDPPLPWDCTAMVTKIQRFSVLRYPASKIGLEDFSMKFDPAAHPLWGIKFSGVSECWVYNVHAPDWTKNNSNGAMVYMENYYKSELRRCHGYTPTPATSSDDGIYFITSGSSGLFEDNSAVGFDQSLMVSGTTVNNLIAYNYFDTPADQIAHKAHPSLDLYEGNVSARAQTDGFHGSASHLTFFRNWYHSHAAADLPGMDVGLSFKRFSRYMVVTGNVLGKDGDRNGPVYCGTPNMGNGSFIGTAQPSLGDFWGDWNTTATLTTRTSDTAGVFTMSGGTWNTGMNAAGGRLIPSVWWNAKANGMVQGTVTSVSGSLVGLSWAAVGGYGGPLPTVGTTVQVYYGYAGWQETDLDVQATLTMTHNYQSSATGTGAVTNSTADILPDSLAHTSKPAWFGSLEWPPINPNSPNYSPEMIPAGYRYVRGTNPPGIVGPVPTRPKTVDGLRKLQE